MLLVQLTHCWFFFAAETLSHREKTPKITPSLCGSAAGLRNIRYSFVVNGFSFFNVLHNIANNNNFSPGPPDTGMKKGSIECSLLTAAGRTVIDLFDVPEIVQGK